jgi:protoporphyrinogen oxidase
MKTINGVKYKSYNDTFIYPEYGCQEFIKSICCDVDMNQVKLNENVIKIDLDNKVVYTENNEYQFNTLVSTLPFNFLLKITGEKVESELNSNKVVVFNIGFDKPSTTDAHWIYYPGNEVFYRVGFYNNILSNDKMSIYVEIGMDSKADVDESYLFNKVISDLKKCGVITNQSIVDYQMLILNPAYVHITKESMKIYNDWVEKNNKNNIYSIGRYGSWTYCSIEDNIIQSKKISELI